MKELFQYKYLSLEYNILEKQRVDALNQFKIDYKEYIVEPQQPPQQPPQHPNTDKDEIIDDNSDNNHSEDESDNSDNLSDKEVDCTKTNDNTDKIEDNDDKYSDNEHKTTVKGRKKHRKRRAIPIEPKTIEDKIILKIYRKLSKILHPDKNPLCVDIFLKLKKYYDEKNILELILMTKTFEIPDSDLSLDLLDLDIYIKEITNMTTKIKTIHENMIWLLYYGNENQKLTVRRNLLDKLNKKED
jgi:hypothetical protein